MKKNIYHAHINTILISWFFLLILWVNALHADGDIIQPDYGGDIIQSYPSGGDTIQPYAGGDVIQQGFGGDVIQPFPSGGDIIQYGNGGDIIQPYYAGGDIIQPYYSGGDVIQPYSDGGDIIQPYSGGGDIIQPYSIGGDVIQTYGSGDDGRCYFGCGGEDGYTGPYPQGQTPYSPYYGGGTYGGGYTGGYGSNYGSQTANNGLSRPVSVMPGGSSASAQAHASASSYAPAVRVGQTMGYGGSASASASAYASASGYGQRTTNYGLTPGIFVPAGGVYVSQPDISAYPYVEKAGDSYRASPHREVTFADPYAKYKAQPGYIENRTATNTKHDQFTLGSLPYTGVDSDILMYLLYLLLVAAAVTLVVRGMIHYTETAFV